MEKASGASNSRSSSFLSRIGSFLYRFTFLSLVLLTGDRGATICTGEAGALSVVEGKKKKRGLDNR